MASTFFWDLANSAGKIGYSGLADLLGLSTRPLALIYAISPWHWATLETVLDGGLLYGLLSTISIALIAISIGALTGFSCPRCLGQAAASAYIADGLAQLPIIIWPATRHIFHYPMSHTGMLVMTVQLRFGLAVMTETTTAPDPIVDTRLWCLSFAIPVRYMSLVLVEPNGSSAYILYGVSVVLFVFAVTPQAFWSFMAKCMKKAAELAQYVFSVVYIALAYICPKIQEFMLAVLQHPFMVGVYQMIVLPIWEFVTPWFLPFAMLSVVCLGVRSFTETGMRMQVLSWPDGILNMVFRLFGLATATASFLIMVLHVGIRKCIREQPDPLRWSLVVKTLTLLARAISFPWKLIRVLWQPFYMYIVFPFFRLLVEALKTLCHLACEVPILSIFLVLLINIVLINYLPLVGRGMLKFFSPLSGLVNSTLQAALDMHSAVSAGTPTDSILAVVFIMSVQIGAYYAIACVLEAVRHVRGEQTQHVLSLDELNDLAVTMSDPRQCARCGFGPVDHRGCTDLRAHHLQVSVSGGSRSSVSNACPRCDWFTGNLQDWLPWDGELQTDRGCAMFRQRVWSEVVVVVRASSKAFLFPSSMLLLGNWLKLCPSLSAFLAFSYLLPWSLENWKLADSINSPNAYGGIRGIRRRDHVPHAAPPGAGDDADCGAAEERRHILRLPNITESEALRNILAASPASIFMAEADICSVCLEQFSDEAVQVVLSGKSVGDACQELRTLNPPVVVLRCGHPLHVDCAEAAVSAGGDRHVRCPLCREPVTLSGDASAVMFS